MSETHAYDSVRIARLRRKIDSLDESIVALSDVAALDVDLSAGAAGSSSNASRADHKHDLDEAIAPSWTGVHTFETYADLQAIATPSNPAGTDRRLFVDSGTNKLSVRTSGGSTVSLEEQGASVTSNAPENVDLAAASAGSSSEAARADHKHDLDESIVPTWTGVHTFSSSQIVIGDGGSAVALNFDVTSNAQIKLNATEIYRLNTDHTEFTLYTKHDSYADIVGISTPSNPASGTRRLFTNTATGELSVRTNAGATVSLEAAASFANPTAEVGLSAVNGVASTAMRSDAAPALSQSIVPTWTGVHTHSAEPVFNAGIDLGTSGVITSDVADGSSKPAFDLLVDNSWSTDEVVLRLLNSADNKVMFELTRYGTMGVGYETLGTPGQADLALDEVVLGFVGDTSQHAQGPLCGGFNWIQHAGTATPSVDWLVGSKSHVGISSNDDAGNYNPCGVDACLSLSSDDAGFAGAVGACVHTSFQQNSTGTSWSGGASVKGAFDRVTGVWIDFASTGLSPGTNMPAVASSIRAPIQAFNATGGEAWAIETMSRRNTGIMDKILTPDTAGCMKVSFPKKGDYMAHFFYACNTPTTTNDANVIGGYAAAAGGPASKKGGEYFDDGTNNQVGLKEHDGNGWLNLRQQMTKQLIVEDPTDSEDLTYFFTPVAITLTELRAVCQGTTPSVTIQINHSTDRSDGTPNTLWSSGQAITSTTTGDSFTSSFNDATIPANSWVWLTTSATSGTIDEIALFIHYDEDPIA